MEVKGVSIVLFHLKTKYILYRNQDCASHLKQERFQEGPTDSFIRQWRKTSSSWAQPFMASSNQIMRNHGTIVNPKPYRALALLRRVLIDLGRPHFNPRFAACRVEL
jgi:hypothetical protein